MNYKLEGAIKKNRKKFIIAIILWLIIVILFIVPFSYSVFQATINGKFFLNNFVEHFIENCSNPLNSAVGIIKNGAIKNFISTLLPFSLFYMVAFFIGFAKSAPKNEYHDIEHGSSDWSQRGEQYRILSKNKGIILAENNYLPLNKMGNLNVLVVGRFWYR